MILALESLVGSEGTLAMPTHTGDLTDPASWFDPSVPEELVSSNRDSMRAFRRDLTPSRDVGVIPECFRKQYGFSTMTSFGTMRTSRRSGAPLSRPGPFPLAGLRSALCQLFSQQSRVDFGTPRLQGLEFTGRTAYEVRGALSLDCTFQPASAWHRALNVVYDKPFLARPTDGGASFEFVSSKSRRPYRAVMPHLRFSPADLVVALRRKSATEELDRLLRVG